MNDLLALLGLAWPRLLLYPGGLFALTLVWLWNKGQRPEVRGEVQASHLVPIISVPPLLAITLLPLPFASQLGRGIDLIVALALLEWPEALLLAACEREEAERRLRRLTLAYGLLLPALLALPQATGSFALDALVARPARIELLPLLLRLGAVSGWALALVPLLALGPFRQHTGPGASMRAVGHILVATLPALALLGERWWLAPLPPLALSFALIATDRWASRSLHPWELTLRAAPLLLWALLAWAALATLLARAT